MSAGRGRRLLPLALGAAAGAGARAGPGRAAARASAPPASMPGSRRRRRAVRRALDVGLLVSDSEATVSAVRFCDNALVGAPIAVTSEARLDGLRAVLANSGNSNVADGSRGLETARASQAAAAAALGIEPELVGLASTGVIGRELPRDALLAGAQACADGARRRQRRLLPGDPDHRQGPEAGLPRGRAAVRRRRAARRPGEGGGNDLAALRDDVLLRRDRRRAGARDARPADRRLRQALVRPDLGRRAAVDLRHGDRVRQRRFGRADRAGVARRAGGSARRWTR